VGVVREVITSVWFKAFGAIGESIYQNARKGDQLLNLGYKAALRLTRKAINRVT
jgi:hypothetical protein